jgi:hypothetical protein
MQHFATLQPIPWNLRVPGDQSFQAAADRKETIRTAVSR